MLYSVKKLSPLMMDEMDYQISLVYILLCLLLGYYQGHSVLGVEGILYRVVKPIIAEGSESAPRKFSALAYPRLYSGPFCIRHIMHVPIVITCLVPNAAGNKLRICTLG